MKLFLTINNKNFVESISTSNFDGVEFIFEDKKSYDKFILDFTSGDSFYLENKMLINKTIKYEQGVLNQIRSKENTVQILKNELKKTDYQIIKCFEAFISNKQMPYDYNILENKRIAWRNEINILEEEIKHLGKVI